ncbi:hypothetical protein MTR67_024055 [Solanum verrucosum]|uniref:Uncharacterized protein n=1 Tax=Solanum verrucosum TaxID=315347 RepID=A0AAF0TY72_SOLVR|nr:hypothetical protein MTR67_024055 [Solanum verrucosum]
MEDNSLRIEKERVYFLCRLPFPKYFVDALDVHLIEELKYGLAFICISVQLSYFDLDECEDEMAHKRQKVENIVQPILQRTLMWISNVEDKYDMHHVLRSLMDNIDDCVFSCHHSTSNATITEE